ncbi:PilL N-terminal domain-containing protein [Vreelandella olivaria]|uniref:PFGI-1 class ICE element type IV pilus protein PilL2 n=1 Tax=Vreelandella olivaria TaxID=390919 RepID=UPI00201F3BC4|nr:PilL N-terminal domain-containing protein [Halomonas olivaria]
MMHPLSPFSIPHSFRILTAGVAVALLAGCAHQQTQSTAETKTYDAATPLEITPEPELVRNEYRVITGPNPPRTGIVDPDVYNQDLIPVEVLRTGRYQLVTTRAPLGQRHLLEQTIHVRIPPSIASTVGDGMRYTLQNTGFSLCSGQENDQRLLFNSPLPATHYALGPMPLREALQVLAGEAWELEVDPVRRSVCYQQRDVRTVESWDLVYPSSGEVEAGRGDEQ